MARPVDAVIASAREFLGERISTNAALREQHSHGEDYQPHALPDAVAFIERAEEAARLLGLCHQLWRTRRPVRRRHLARGARHPGARRH